MEMTQRDLGRLSDDEIRSLGLALEEGAGDRCGGIPDFWRHVASTLRRGLTDRCRAVAVAELYLLNDEEAAGSLVEPGTEPVGDAQEQLRRGAP